MTNAQRDQLDRGWDELLAVVDDVPAARLAEPGVAGDWSVKDLLGHIAFWEGRAVARLKRRAAGEPDPPSQDYEPINQREHALRRDWSAAQVREELTETHAQLLAALDAQPDFDPDELSGNTWEHYAEHVADIRAWLERGEG
jgi:uncharacterized protein (TIGR03083 family)